MADPNTINLQIFQPNDGGFGKRFAVTTSSGGTAYRVPGLSGGTDGNAAKRILVSNGGAVSAFVRMGPASVTATLDALEILPGCAYLLTPPDVNPSGVWIAGLTEAGVSSISAMFGYGT